MTVRRGQDWGSPGALSPGAPVADSDAELAALLASAMAAGEPGPLEAGLLDGDLHRTLGAPVRTEDQLRSGGGVRYPCDAVLVEADVDGAPVAAPAVAHVVARGRRLFASRTVVIMNAAFIGDANLGPRAHPGDGLLDVTDGMVARREVRSAIGRTRTGTHVPHPGLAERRVGRYEAGTDGPAWMLVLDGVPVGRTTRFRVSCLPDALVVVA